MNRVLFQQLLRGDYGVEEAVALDAGVKLPEIDQHGSNRHVGADVEPLHFAGDLILDIVADFKLTLRLDDVRRAGGLDEKIYLAASASRISPVAVGRGGNDDAVADMQMRDDFAEVVDYQVFELESHCRMPVGQGLQRSEAIGTVLDLDDMRLDVFKIEPRVVVADAIASCAAAVVDGLVEQLEGPEPVFWRCEWISFLRLAESTPHSGVKMQYGNFTPECGARRICRRFKRRGWRRVRGRHFAAFAKAR